MNLKNKVVVITGASSGIGKELAFQFSKKGSRLVLAARNKRALDEIAQQMDPSLQTVLVAQTDVSDRSQVRALVKKTKEKFGQLDVYMNNAGVSLAQGPLIQNKEADVRSTMEINFMAGIYSVWEAVPLMEEGGGGQLVFVSSCIGKRGVPDNAVYCASKFALQGLTESLRLELKKKRIHVITICPPGVDTPFFENNQRGERKPSHLHSVQKISAQIIRACEKEKREVLQTLDSKILHWGNVFFPELLDWAISKKKDL